jgi:molybdopterin converting factor small subunit
MKIKVRLFSYLCSMLGKEGNRCLFNIEIENDATCDDLLRILNIPLDLPILIFVNEAAREKRYLLHQSDEVSIVPIVDGG